MVNSNYSNYENYNIGDRNYDDEVTDQSNQDEVTDQSNQIENIQNKEKYSSLITDFFSKLNKSLSVDTFSGQSTSIAARHSIFSRGAGIVLSSRLIYYCRENNALTINNESLRSLANAGVVAIAGVLGRVHMAVVAPLAVLKDTLLIPIDTFKAIKHGYKNYSGLGKIYLDRNYGTNTLFGYQVKSEGVMKTALTIIGVVIRPFTTIATTAVILTVGYEAISNRFYNPSLYEQTIDKILIVISGKFINPKIKDG